MRSALQSLTLTDFRSYDRAELATGRPQRLPVRPERGGEDQPPGSGQPAVARARHARGEPRRSSGGGCRTRRRAAPGRSRRRSRARRARFASARGSRRPARRGGMVRVEGETVPPGRMAEHVRPLWLTPAQDRLFLEGAAERRRFFDRLVFAAEPIHAAHAGAYERSAARAHPPAGRRGARSGLAHRARGPHGRGRRAGRRGARGDARRPAGRDRPARRPPVPARRARPHRRLRTAGARRREARRDRGPPGRRSGRCPGRATRLPDGR